ncbi:hypothetical protein EDB86DRAFT_3073548 [Lactarius hatsudake]|nr:hypothetical protein EDB86DRAFT_3073548 [Lactarius hatsudake]
MTGANYTGGKRNFARARFRDSTRRAQKSHFGRRRLEILSRGLGNAAQRNEEEPSGISGILLEHAQKEFSRPLEYMRSSRTEGPDTLSGPSSPLISGHTIKLCKVMLDSESYPSLRAEVNRVLEFSRTVGLCNYPSSSRRRSDSASLTSDVDSESKVGSSQRQNCYNGSPISDFSERQHLRTPVASGSGATDPRIIPNLRLITFPGAFPQHAEVTSAIQAIPSPPHLTTNINQGNATALNVKLS